MQETKPTNEDFEEKLLENHKNWEQKRWCLKVGGPLADRKKRENRARDGREMVKEENSKKCYGLAPLKLFIRATCNQKPWVPCHRV